jgi:hypothetical protein
LCLRPQTQGGDFDSLFSTTIPERTTARPFGWMHHSSPLLPCLGISQAVAPLLASEKWPSTAMDGRWPILNFALFAKFRVGISPKPWVRHFSRLRSGPSLHGRRVPHSPNPVILSRAL